MFLMYKFLQVKSPQGIVSYTLEKIDYVPGGDSKELIIRGVDVLDRRIYVYTDKGLEHAFQLSVTPGPFNWASPEPVGVQES